MNGNKALLDTNGIIFASKNLLDIDKLLNDHNEFAVSIITLMEVYGYNFKNEKEKSLIDTLFENMEIIDVDSNLANRVIGYRKNSKKKIKLPDAIILASASISGYDLLTDD